MGLFDGFKKKKVLEIGCPVKGECVSIKEVPDPTFGEEILGKGVAVKPQEGRFYAPVSGTIATLFPTLHALAITTEEGAELLLHIGLDTVKLKGEHFQAHVQEGDKVEKGDLLMEVNLEGIREAGYDTITPMVICNSDEFDIQLTDAGLADVGKCVMSLKKK